MARHWNSSGHGRRQGIGAITAAITVATVILLGSLSKNYSFSNQPQSLVPVHLALGPSLSLSLRLHYHYDYHPQSPSPTSGKRLLDGEMHVRLHLIPFLDHLASAALPANPV